MSPLHISLVTERFKIVPVLLLLLPQSDPDLTASAMLRQKWDLKLYSDDVAGGMARIEERMLTRMNQSDKLVATLFKEITGRDF